MPSYNAGMVTTIIREAIEAEGRGAQSRVARDVGVAVQTVNKWVKGQVHPEPARWPRIEEALGLEPGTIEQRSGSRPTAADDEVVALRREVAELRAKVEWLMGRSEGDR